MLKVKLGYVNKIANELIGKLVSELKQWNGISFKKFVNE